MGVKKSGAKKKVGVKKLSKYMNNQKSEISSHVITNETKGNPFTFSCVKSDKQTNTQTHKQTNRQTDKQTNRQTDKQTNRQTIRVNCVSKYRPL